MKTTWTERIVITTLATTPLWVTLAMPWVIRFLSWYWQWVLGENWP